MYRAQQRTVSGTTQQGSQLGKAAKRRQQAKAQATALTLTGFQGILCRIAAHIRFPSQGIADTDVPLDVRVAKLFGLLGLPEKPTKQQSDRWWGQTRNNLVEGAHGKPQRSQEVIGRPVEWGATAQCVFRATPTGVSCRACIRVGSAVATVAYAVHGVCVCAPGRVHCVFCVPLGVLCALVRAHGGGGTRYVTPTGLHRSPSLRDMSPSHRAFRQRHQSAPDDDGGAAADDAGVLDRSGQLFSSKSQPALSSSHGPPWKARHGRVAALRRSASSSMSRRRLPSFPRVEEEPGDDDTSPTSPPSNGSAAAAGGSGVRAARSLGGLARRGVSSVGSSAGGGAVNTSVDSGSGSDDDEQGGLARDGASRFSPPPVPPLARELLRTDGVSVTSVRRGRVGGPISARESVLSTARSAGAGDATSTNRRGSRASSMGSAVGSHGEQSVEDQPFSAREGAFAVYALAHHDDARL